MQRVLSVLCAPGTRSVCVLQPLTTARCLHVAASRWWCRDTVASPAAFFSMVMIGVFNYFGLNLILTMINFMGAAQTVFFTSLRKGCTLVLSYMLFPKAITMQHIVGGALIGGGILMNDKVWCAHS
jgi:drug/metabolite transporter (DMT)-like permease